MLSTPDSMLPNLLSNVRSNPGSNTSTNSSNNSVASAYAPTTKSFINSSSKFGSSSSIILHQQKQQQLQKHFGQHRNSLTATKQQQLCLKPHAPNLLLTTPTLSLDSNDDSLTNDPNVGKKRRKLTIIFNMTDFFFTQVYGGLSTMTFDRVSPISHGILWSIVQFSLLSLLKLFPL